MTFKAGEQAPGSVPFTSDDERINKTGLNSGKHRSTIARKVLEMRSLFKADTFEKLQALYPDITKESTAEEIMTIVHVDKAISEQDEKSYRAIMDSAYGLPKQEFDHTTLGEKLPAPIIYSNTPPLSSNEQEVKAE